MYLYKDIYQIHNHLEGKMGNNRCVVRNTVNNTVTYGSTYPNKGEGGNDIMMLCRSGNFPLL